MSNSLLLFSLQSNQNKQSWRNRPFPYFEQLTIVFGKDHTPRRDAQSYADITQEMDALAKEEYSATPIEEEEMLASENLGEDVPCSETATNNMSEATSGSKRK